MAEAPLRLLALLQLGPQVGHRLGPPLLITQSLQQPHALHIPERSRLRRFQHAADTCVTTMQVCMASVHEHASIAVKRLQQKKGHMRAAASELATSNTCSCSRRILSKMAQFPVGGLPLSDILGCIPRQGNHIRQRCVTHEALLDLICPAMVHVPSGLQLQRVSVTSCHVQVV